MLRLTAPVADVLRSLAAHNVLGGFELAADCRNWAVPCWCATELRTAGEIADYAAKLARIMYGAHPGQMPGGAQVQLKRHHAGHRKSRPHRSRHNRRIHMAQVTLHGSPANTNGDLPAVGSQAPVFGSSMARSMT